MRNSEKVTQTFNGKVEWLTAGGYFKLMSTVNPVTVELFNRGELVHKASSVEGGHYQRIGFDRVAITTGAAEAVSWLYAPEEGGSDRFSGSVGVTGPVDVGDRAARLLGIVYGSLGQLAQELLNGVNALVVACKGTLGTLAQGGIGAVNHLWITPRVGFGASVATSINPLANVAVQLVAPAANTGGMTVWRSSVSVKNGGTSWQVSILAKSSAPASVIDGEPVATTDSIASDAAGVIIVTSAKQEQPLYIPAGKGLYYITSGNSDIVLASVLYTLH